jgi:hypothetical protein
VPRKGQPLERRCRCGIACQSGDVSPHSNEVYTAGVDSRNNLGYTAGMKTAISVPDRVFREAEQHARRMGKSRSQLYSQAMSEYLFRHAPDAVTDAMNKVCDQVGSERDAFATVASRRMLRKETW